MRFATVPSFSRLASQSPCCYSARPGLLARGGLHAAGAGGTRNAQADGDVGRELHEPTLQTLGRPVVVLLSPRPRVARRASSVTVEILTPD